MRKLSSHLKVFFYFGLFFVAGLSLFFSISEDMSIQRDPAAINGKVFQISNLSSEQIKQQLVQKIRVQAVVVGQKALRLDGFSSAVCRTYSHIELQFEAEGMVVAGVRPEMTIKAPCEAGQDPAEIASILIPFDKILAEKPRNAEFTFDGFKPKFEFKNSSDEWPRTWILRSVQFNSDQTANKLVRLDGISLNQLIVLEF